MHVGLVARGDISIALDLANTLNRINISATLYLSHPHVVKITGDSNRPIEILYESGILPRACKVQLVNPPRMRDPRSFIQFRKLCNTIIKDKVNVVHILLGPGELWFALLAYFLRRIPIVSTMVVPKPNLGEELPFFVVWIIYKLLTYGSDMIIVNGTDQVPLVKRLYRISDNKIAVVPLSIHDNFINESFQSHIVKQGAILFFGRAHRHKGLEYLIKAQPLISRKVPSARIVISAHGRDLGRCRSMIQDSSKFEIYEGVVNENVASDFFKKASIVALPYISASTSGVLLKAYSFGKPVVATNVGCLSEYVKNGVTGFLVPPRNIEKLAEAISCLLLDDALRQRMGKNARSLIKEEQNKIIMKLIEVYDKAILLHRKH